MSHPWWPHLISFPRFLDPISWLWLSVKGYAISSSLGLGWLATVGVLLRHHNCHEPGCPWLGKYPVEGTPFKVCRKHHPTIPPDLAQGDIHRMHADALRAERKEGE